MRDSRATPTSTTSGRSLAARLVAPCVLLLLASQLGALAHRFLVAHRRCVEHGALVHAGDAHGASATRAADQRRQVVDAPPGSAERDHDHEHCQLTTTLREAVAHDAATEQLEPPSGDAAHGASPRSPRGARALWRAAPKTSPPV